MAKSKIHITILIQEENCKKPKNPVVVDYNPDTITTDFSSVPNLKDGDLVRINFKTGEVAKLEDR
jgi:hypothetical protein